MTPLLIYVTCSDQNEAKRLASHLLEQRLIACANIMAPHIAVYEWDGEICDEPETVVIFKTSNELYEKLETEIIKHHSYDVPCILALDIEKGHKPFLDWINDATGAKAS